MTHQEIFKSLDKKDQKKFQNLFDNYEKDKFDRNIKISLKNFYVINLQILRYALSRK